MFIEETDPDDYKLYTYYSNHEIKLFTIKQVILNTTRKSFVCKKTQ